MEFHYRIFPEFNLIIIRRRGIWTVDAFIESVESMREAVSPYPLFDMVSDMRELQADIVPQEISRLAQHFGNNPTTRGESLLLVSRPLETALAMLYREKILPLQNVSIFSSLEGVSAYKGIDIAPLIDALPGQAQVQHHNSPPAYSTPHLKEHSYRPR